MATVRQVEANRENGAKGGVKTEEGKLISRLNARKHGIFASALTTEDSEDLYGIEDELIAALRPVGRLEEMVVEKIALTYLRMQRCARAEAEYHVRTWAKPNKHLQSREWDSRQEKLQFGARAVTFREDVFTRMVKLIDLYDSRLTNQFLKLTREIERLQRLRADGDSPWPAAADPASRTEEAPPAADVPKIPIPPISPITPKPAAPTAADLKAQADEDAAMKLAYNLVAEEAERKKARLLAEAGLEEHDATSI